MSRCSTWPVSVISTVITRVEATRTSSTCRMRERDSEGYCTRATWWVSCESSRTVRPSTWSRSAEEPRKVSIAVRWAGLNGRRSASRLTKTRYPLSVGMRPDEVCGAAMSSSSSSSAMSLRMVAAETPNEWRSTIDLDPTGSREAT
jgi:hypothetical protein